MEEIWKDIKGYEGLYQISNFKRIKSLQRINFGGNLLKEKILNGSSNGKYRTIWLTKNGKAKLYYIDKLHYINFEMDK